MSFMDDFEESELGDDIDLSQIPGFEPPDDTPPAAALKPEGEVPAEPDPDKYVSKEKYESLQSQIGDLKDMMLAQRNQPAPQPQYQQPQQPQITKEQLEQQYYADPVGFTARMSQAAAANSFGGDLGQIRETLTEQMIQNFTGTKQAEPVFKAAKKHFDELLNKTPRQQLARLTPAQQSEFLDISYNAALGKVYQEVIAKQQAKRPAAQPVPQYGGGSAASSAPARRNNADGVDERLMKHLGLTAEDFAEINDG